MKTRRVFPPEGIGGLIERLKAEEGRIRVARDREREAWAAREQEFKDGLQRISQDLEAAVATAAGVLKLPPGSRWVEAELMFEAPDDSPETPDGDPEIANGAPEPSQTPD